MGFFDRFRENKGIDIQAEKGKIYAPISGSYIPLEEIADPVFSSGTLGKGCGIDPAEGVVYAPIEGTISTVAETQHALGITGTSGEEYLIHVGMDTVDMAGRGFSVKVEAGEKVQAGQLILEFDMGEIEKARHPATTAFVLTNSDEYPSYAIDAGKTYRAGEEIGQV